MTASPFDLRIELRSFVAMSVLPFVKADGILLLSASALSDF